MKRPSLFLLTVVELSLGTILAIIVWYRWYRMDFPGPSIPLLAVLVLLGNILGYRVKALLRSHGYEVSWFYGMELSKFMRLIAQTEDPRVRRNYRLLLIAFVCTGLAMLLGVLGSGFLWASGRLK